MGWNARLRNRVTPFLDADERLDAVFPAQTGVSPYLPVLLGPTVVASSSTLMSRNDLSRGPLVALLVAVVLGQAILTAFATRGWVVAATDRRLLVLATGRFRRTVPVRIDAELPRQKFGRSAGIWRSVRVGDRVMRVHFRRADPMGHADDVLTSEGDRSIPEPVPGPSTVRRVFAGLALVALVAIVPLAIALLPSDDASIRFEPVEPVGGVTVIGSGQFSAGTGWRVEAFRNANDKVCSRQVFVFPPVPPAADGQPGTRRFSTGGGSCGTRLHDWSEGLRQDDDRVFAGQVDAEAAAVNAAYCDGSTARFRTVRAVGERWIAFAAPKLVRELVELNSNGKVIERHVIEDSEPLLDGQPLPTRSLTEDESGRVNVVRASPCDRRAGP